MERAAGVGFVLFDKYHRTTKGAIAALSAGALFTFFGGQLDPQLGQLRVRLRTIDQEYRGLVAAVADKLEDSISNALTGQAAQQAPVGYRQALATWREDALTRRELSERIATATERYRFTFPPGEAMARDTDAARAKWDAVAARLAETRAQASRPWRPTEPGVASGAIGVPEVATTRQMSQLRQAVAATEDPGSSAVLATFESGPARKIWSNLLDLALPVKQAPVIAELVASVPVLEPLLGVLTSAVYGSAAEVLARRARILVDGALASRSVIDAREVTRAAELIAAGMPPSWSSVPKELLAAACASAEAHAAQTKEVQAELAAEIERQVPIAHRKLVTENRVLTQVLQQKWSPLRRPLLAHRGLPEGLFEGQSVDPDPALEALLRDLRARNDPFVENEMLKAAIGAVESPGSLQARVVRMQLEERALAGDEYARYVARVRFRLMPFIY